MKFEVEFGVQLIQTDVDVLGPVVVGSESFAAKIIGFVFFLLIRSLRLSR